MRICSIVNSLTTGGAEVLVSALTEEFARLGERPLVIALCDAQTVGNSPETEDRMIHEIRAAGGEFQSLGLSPGRNPVSGALGLRQVLGTFRPDVVHAHTVRALPMLAMGHRSAPTVLTHHNTRLPFPPWMFKLFDRMTDTYVAIGAEVEEILERHVDKPIVRIANAANRSFKAGDPRTAPAPAPQILSVGAISKQKNYDLLIEVAAAFKSSGGPTATPRFRVAGGGAELEPLRAKTRARGVDDIVEFLGERSDVRDLMADSDIYLNVSLFEGMPLTLLEAMASGLPIVATDVPGNRELVDQGSNGLRARLGDSEAIAQSIASILADPQLYRRLSLGSIEKGKEFSIDRAALLHRDLYSRLIADRNRG